MTRLEKDSFGTIKVASDRLWGAQTQRSLAHFAISTERMPAELIHALALVKAACAGVNRELGLLAAEQFRRAVGEHFVEVHVGLRPRTGLPH